MFFIDPRSSTNKSKSLKSDISGDGVRPYIRTYKTKQTDQRVKPFFKLVLWLVLGRGSLHDSSLVLFYSHWTKFRIYYL